MFMFFDDKALLPKPIRQPAQTGRYHHETGIERINRLNVRINRHSADQTPVP